MTPPLGTLENPLETGLQVVVQIDEARVDGPSRIDRRHRLEAIGRFRLRLLDRQAAYNARAMALEDIKTVVEILKGAVEGLAIIGAGWWFLRQSLVQKRVSFDVSCTFVFSESGKIIAEVAFEFENKGFVEHRLYDLSLAVHCLGKQVEPSAQSKHLFSDLFSRTLMPKQEIVPPKYGYYFVRPGVRQAIRHLVLLDDPGSVICVTGGFNYTPDGNFPHTARRVFQVPHGNSTAS